MPFYKYLLIRADYARITMLKFYKIILLVSFSRFCGSEMMSSCKQQMPMNFDFYIMQTCTASQENKTDGTFARDFDSCKCQTLEKRGLAFNYVDPVLADDKRNNCISYDCPEFNVTALKRDSIYHYYSAYAEIWPAENMTCLPKEGLYMLTKEKLNYTEAIDKCEEYNGMLMNVIGPLASERAAKVIKNSKISSNLGRLQAYIGLDDIEQEGRFRNLYGELLYDSPWRAWAPGEPRSRYKNEDCATIDLFQHWRVQPCYKKLPFICEILPGGPLNLTKAYCHAKEDVEEKKNCHDHYLLHDTIDEREVCNHTTSKQPETNNITRSEMMEL